MNRMLAAAARNPVFANLLMVFLLVAGFMALRNTRREMFPEFSFDRVVVRVLYPGATPSEIEESITIKIEEGVRRVDGVRKVESVSTEGLASVTAEIDAAIRDPQQALVDIRNEVDRITTFPEDAEEPEVNLILNRHDAITIALHGPVDETSLGILAREIEQELLLLPEVSEVEVSGLRPYQINITVREKDLQRYGLTFPQVAEAIRNRSLDLPIGQLRSSSEEQLLRIEAKRKQGRDLARLPILVKPDGTRILLRDVARVSDAFEEDELHVRLDGEPAVEFKIRRTSNQDTLEVAAAVRRYMEERNKTLPGSLALSLWKDDSVLVVDRLSLLATNGLEGLLLVFAILFIVLGFRLSFWVALGLPIAFLAAILILVGLFGGSLNMITSFALIMVLGILVDDSIIVGENIARHMRKDGYTTDSAVRGLLEVAIPVIAAVTTTAIAFLPLFFIGGIMGKFIRIMPVAVIACLIASLIEALLILPAHLAHQRPPKENSEPGLRERIETTTDRLIEEWYGPVIQFALRHRYVVVAGTTAFLIVIAGLVASGRPGFIFFPRLDSEYIQATVAMPQGTPIERTAAVVDRLEEAARKLKDRWTDQTGRPVMRRLLTKVGTDGPHKATILAELSRSSERDVKSLSVIKEWDRVAGSFPEARSVVIGEVSRRPGGRPIEIRVLTSSRDAGLAATERLRKALESYPGVFNIEDNLEPGKREIRFRITPRGEALGVTLGSLGRQLHSGFMGNEAMKIQRNRDEVEIRIRYDAGMRKRLEQLSDVRVRTGDRRLLPLNLVAKVERSRSLSRIERRDGRRVVVLSADVDDAVTNANAIVQNLTTNVLPELSDRVDVVFGGQQEEQKETMQSLIQGFLIAMFGIYAILSLVFGSYLQPVIIMMVIPAGFGGAILGHLLFGQPIMIFSVFGMVGLAGIVVNDALVLIDFINRHREEGHTPIEAAEKAGVVRFRPVFLTTVTTVAGLLPILLETSLQAQFIIPMALSIAAGVASATVLTLLVVPSLYLCVEDIRKIYVRTPEE